MSLLRERLRVERELVGKAHPFIVTSLIVRRGEDVKVVPPSKENPLLVPVKPKRVLW